MPTKKILRNVHSAKKILLFSFPFVVGAPFSADVWGLKRVVLGKLHLLSPASLPILNLWLTSAAYIGRREEEQAAGCFHQNMSLNSTASERSNDLTLDGDGNVGINGIPRGKAGAPGCVPGTVWDWREESDSRTGRNYEIKSEGSEKKGRELKERERGERGVVSEKDTTGRKTKSGLFIFWIDRSDGMEPCVRMKAAVLLARTFLAHEHMSAHMFLILLHNTHVQLHTHPAHMEVGILMDRWGLALVLAQCCRPAWAQALISPSFFLSGALAKGAVFSRASRHGAI